MFGSLTEKEINGARVSLSKYGCIRPDVVTLAMLASLARRIEPELLRALRLALSDRFSAELRPTVATEATLWFSPFIESRGPDNITLLPEFSQLLRERLRADQGLLDAARKVVEDCHQLVSPVIRWEEELVYLSLKENMAEPEHKRVFEQNIWRVVKAISKNDRPALDEWIVEMGNRLPEAANLNPLFSRLRNISTARIIRHDSRFSKSSTSLDLAELDFSNVPHVVLDVLKIGNDFRIGYLSGSGQFGIRVPNIQPITIDILQHDGSSNAMRSLVILPGESIDIPVRPSPTRVRTFDGHIYSLDQKLFEQNDISESFQQKSGLQPYKVLRGHSGQVWGVAITPDGRRAISGSYDNTLRVWDLQSWASLNTLSGHTDRVFGVAISPDGRFAVSSSADGTILVWDLASNGDCVAILKGHTKGVCSIAVTPDGQRIISGSFDKTLRIWDAKTFQCAATLEGHTDSVFGVAVAPNGRYVVSASADRTLRVWDLETTRCIVTLEGHSRSVDCVAITPDEQLIISGSRDNTVRLWDFRSSKGLAVLEGHNDAIIRLAVTSDGRWALTSSLDKTVRIWDLINRECVKSIGSTKYLTSIAITPDGHRAVFGTNDNSIWIWNLLADFEINSTIKYDVAFSFAREDRPYVENVLKALQGKINVFYDFYEKSNLVGENLPNLLEKIFKERARYCVIFISKYYLKSKWTQLELKCAQARAISEKYDYVIPVLLDNTEISGISSAIGFLDGRKENLRQIADMILQKCSVGGRLQNNIPDQYIDHKLAIVDWMITSECDYACRCCFKPKNIPDLDLECAKKVVDILHRLYIKTICISGGEPLKYRYIDEMLKYIYEKGIKVCLSTNGEHFWNHKEPIEHYVNRLSLSLDGSTNEIHSENGRENNYKNVLSILDYYQQYARPFQIRVCTLLTSKNINVRNNLLNIYNLLAKYSIDLWKIYELIPEAGARLNMIRCGYLESTFTNTIQDFRSNLKGQSPFQIVVSRRKERDRSYFIIQPNGDVIIPEDNGEYVEEITLGNILIDQIDIILDKWGKKANFVNYNSNVRFRKSENLPANLSQQESIILEEIWREAWKEGMPQTPKIIGKKLHIDEFVIKQRIKDLHSRGFLDKFVPIINISRFGLISFNVFLSIDIIDKKTQNHILEGLMNHQAIPWIASIGGVSQWTYLIAIFAKSMHHYNEIMMQIKEICQDKLKDYEMLWLIDEYFFGQRYLFTSGKKETDFSYREYRIPLEEKAYSYIHNEEYKMLLRISEFEQYYQLNFSSEFELDVKRLADIVYDLKSKDIIIGLMPVCDIRALGLEWYIILLRLKKLSKKEKDNFMKFMSNYLQIFHIIFCTGKWEVKIELHVKDQEQFDDIFSSIRTNFDDIIYGEPYYFKILAEFKLNYLVKSVFVDWRMNE